MPPLPWGSAPAPASKRLFNAGQLQAWERTDPDDRRMLELDGLAERAAELVRSQCNTPLQPDPSPTPRLLDWERVAQLANEGLDLPAWGLPPWSALRWSSLGNVLQQAIEDAAAEADW